MEHSLERTGPPALPTEPAQWEPVLARAMKGDPESQALARRIMDRYPAALQIDWGRSARNAIIDAIAGQEWGRELLHRDAERKYRELGGAEATPLERLLVERVVCCWLALNKYEVAIGRTLKEGSVDLDLLTRQHELVNVLQRRYIAAIRGLAQLRRLQATDLTLANALGKSG